MIAAATSVIAICIALVQCSDELLPHSVAPISTSDQSVLLEVEAAKSQQQSLKVLQLLLMALKSAAAFGPPGPRTVSSTGDPSSAVARPLLSHRPHRWGRRSPQMNNKLTEEVVSLDDYMKSLAVDDLKPQQKVEEKPKVQHASTVVATDVKPQSKAPASAPAQVATDSQAQSKAPERPQTSAPAAVKKPRSTAPEQTDAGAKLASETQRAQEKLQLISNVHAGAPVKASLTTHEGQMRWLKEQGGKFDLLPTAILSEKALAGDFEPNEGAGVLDKGFPWQDNEFEEGVAENAALLEEIEANFTLQTGARPPNFEGLETALDDPENLRASLDLAVCYLKNHQLDKCEILLGRYTVPACMARGMPWIVKGLQDYATLRMKQRRCAESMVLLEKLESMVPPHPVMLHNIGLAYNSMRMHDKAMEKFNKAIDLNDGKKNFDDYWQVGITHMHKGEYDPALSNLTKALALADADGFVDMITLGKLNGNVASCLASALYDLPKDQKEERLKLAQKAEPFIRDSLSLYEESAGKGSLYGMASHDLGKNLRDQGRFREAEPYFYDAIEIESNRDAIHPTLCWHMVNELMEVYQGGGVPKELLPKYNDLLRTMLHNLHIRGFLEDGNGGVVMHRIAEFLMLSGEEFARPVMALLNRGLKLVENHKEDVQDTSAMQMVMKIQMEQLKALPARSEDNQREAKSESWLVEGAVGAPPVLSRALGVDEVDIR